MRSNSLTWLAMFLSAAAGTLCAHVASKVTDGRIEATLSIPAALTDSGPGTTVALIREGRDGSAPSSTVKR